MEEVEDEDLGIKGEGRCLSMVLLPLEWFRWESLSVRAN